MAYVAVRGGQEAIEASLALLAWERVRPGCSVEIKDIMAAFPDLIDQVMGESSLYAPELAALALKQAQGSCEEAVFLLRAFRSTLERPYVSCAVEPDAMRCSRRISAAFKDIPGGQILGATRDYSHRLIDFNLRKESTDTVRELRREMKRIWKEGWEADGLCEGDGFGGDDGAEAAQDLLPEASVRPPKKGAKDAASPPLGAFGRLPKVADYLRAQGLLAEYDADDATPADATMEPLVFPTPRSMRLQVLARGMTQGVVALGYAAIRGFGLGHPTVAELRYGEVEIAVEHPLGTPGASGDPLQAGRGDAYYLGAIPVTEVEGIFELEVENADGGKEFTFDLGYGMVMGRGETKAIAMSVLDFCLRSKDKRFPTQDEEFVLYHVDGIEATGFISHLKLPHYVTFQSKLSSVRKAKDLAKGSADKPADEPATGPADKSTDGGEGGNDDQAV
ncbi:MAG: carbon-phosphorus lyase complex subunit PhnI [Eggerthellaceae bacterium]|jgi:alpha-D-ribose 1-methylphosphonate 5-triphosphate synthase subunit PhnI|nr:carbon-phosphorus lyase complex subunit PhnI [Eggerthellaceae bacterium]MDR2715494.1 carbon-phosphorus lyase complex subunit PhnI [Coriobacteriaceae bacterium]